MVSPPDWFYGQVASLWHAVRYLDSASFHLHSTQKSPLYTWVYKGRMSRGTTFSCRFTILSNISASLPSVTGSPGTAYAPVGFGYSVQKLPSAPAIPDRLSAGELSSLLARSTYSSFSSLFSDGFNLNEPFFVCQVFLLLDNSLLQW